MDRRNALVSTIWLIVLVAWFTALLYLAGCTTVTITQNGDGDMATVATTQNPIVTATIPVQVGPGSLPGLPGMPALTMVGPVVR